MASQPTLASRIRGALYGLATVDALGAPVEFHKRGTFDHVTSMRPNPNFGLPAGHFTDDTSMALCLAHSLLEHGPFTNPVDQARKYIRWKREGWMSSTDRCFDIGVSTSEVLAAWEEMLGDGDNDRGVNEAMQEVLSQRFGDEERCGNGSLMRVLPVALLFAGEPSGSERGQSTGPAMGSSRVTHPAYRCSLCCMAYVDLVGMALVGKGKQEMVEHILALLATLRDIVEGSLVGIDAPFHERLGVYKTVEDFVTKPEAEIRSSGYVLDSLEAALWAFFSTTSFRDGAIKVVNLGDDADTVGAIYGGLAGAYYGFDEIPKEWLEQMKKMELVEEVVEQIIKIRIEGPPDHWKTQHEPTAEEIEWIQKQIRDSGLNLH